MSAMNEGPECQMAHTAKIESHSISDAHVPNFCLVFHNSSNEEIGRLDFNGPGLSFEGIADLSAVTFMDWIGQVFRARLEQEYQRGYKEGKKQNEAND